MYHSSQRWTIENRCSRTIVANALTLCVWFELYFIASNNKHSLHLTTFGTPPLDYVEEQPCRLYCVSYIKQPSHNNKTHSPLSFNTTTMPVGAHTKGHRHPAAISIISNHIMSRRRSLKRTRAQTKVLCRRRATATAIGRAQQVILR